MEEYLFTFRSVTAAMQAGKELERAGVAHLLVRLPKLLRGRGCGYGLKVRDSLFLRAKAALSGAEVQPRGMYQRAADGQWREVAQ